MSDNKKKKTLVIALLLVLLLGAGAAGTLVYVSGAKQKADAFDAVSQSMDAEQLEDYLAKYPDEASSPKLVALTEEIKYSSALADNEIGTYESFLAAYPASPHIAEITENLDWLKTEADHGDTAYEAFITTHPESPYIPRAKLRLGQNGFWARTKPVRDRFMTILKNDDAVSAAFYPQYAEYASKLIAYDLVYEAAAILAVLQYHHSAGTLACYSMAMNSLSFSGDIYSMNAGLRKSQMYQAKAKVMSNLDYADVVDSINDLAVQGDVEIDRKGILASTEEAVDEAEQLKNMLKYVKITPYTVQYPDFVTPCVDFVGSQGDTSMLKILSAIHLPESSGYIATNSPSYAPSAFFNGLGMTARRHRDAVLALLDAQDERGKAVLIYGFGIADDRRVEEKIRSILDTTEDTRLKVACWYALCRFGRDYSADLNSELATALGESGDLDVAADILTAWQWMRDKGMEGKVDRALLKKALATEHKTVLFFAQAILQDLLEPLTSEEVNRVLALSRNEDRQVQERASALLSASQSSLAEVMKNSFPTMSTNEQAQIISSLTPETFISVENSVRPLIDNALGNDFKGDTSARDQIIGSVGGLKLSDYTDELVALVKDDNSLRAAISLVLLYQEKGEEGKALLSGVNSVAGLTARAFLGDETAVSKLKGKLDSYSIHEVLDGIGMSRLLNNSSFYSRFFKLMRYTNSSYEPTDYLVAFNAQTATMELLLDNRDLRQELRSTL